MATKETKEANATLQQEVQKRQSAKAKMCEHFCAEEQVEVSGSPFYQPYFGSSMPIMINGILVYVPLDGRPHSIPKSFADLFNERIKRIDAQNEKYNLMGEIVHDDYIGDNEALGLNF